MTNEKWKETWFFRGDLNSKWRRRKSICLNNKHKQLNQINSMFVNDTATKRNMCWLIYHRNVFVIYWFGTFLVNIPKSDHVTNSIPIFFSSSFVNETTPEKLFRHIISIGLNNLWFNFSKIIRFNIFFHLKHTWTESVNSKRRFLDQFCCKERLIRYAFNVDTKNVDYKESFLIEMFIERLGMDEDSNKTIFPYF